MKLTKEQIIYQLNNSEIGNKELIVCSPKSYCELVDLYPQREKSFTYSFYLKDGEFYKMPNHETEHLYRIDFDG